MLILLARCDSGEPHVTSSYASEFEFSIFFFFKCMLILLARCDSGEPHVTSSYASEFEFSIFFFVKCMLILLGRCDSGEPHVRCPATALIFLHFSLNDKLNAQFKSSMKIFLTIKYHKIVTIGTHKIIAVIIQKYEQGVFSIQQCVKNIKETAP